MISPNRHNHLWDTLIILILHMRNWRLRSRRCAQEHRALTVAVASASRSVGLCDSKAHGSHCTKLMHRVRKTPKHSRVYFPKTKTCMCDIIQPWESLPYVILSSTDSIYILLTVSTVSSWFLDQDIIQCHVLQLVVKTSQYLLIWNGSSVFPCLSGKGAEQKRCWPFIL